jgi:hypothetical protein
MSHSIEPKESSSQESCPICNSNRASDYWAIIAPFIRNYVKPAHASLLTLRECHNCEHRYFSYRYNDIEMERLYSRYRGESYYHARHSFEPWYGRAVNSCNLDPMVIGKRIAGLLSFLLPLLPPEKHRLVVADLGGDAGQFIPLHLASKAYVIEASHQKPVQGVITIPDLSYLHEDVDLLICSHVLEHIPSPRSFLQSQVSYPCINRGCYVYLEVPLERYKLASGLRSRAYASYLRYIARLQPILIIVDFFSVAARSLLGFIVPPLILKMHEHINIFSLRSVQILISSLDLELIKVVVESESHLSTHQGVIRVLARKR